MKTGAGVGGATWIGFATGFGAGTTILGMGNAGAGEKRGLAGRGFGADLTTGTGSDETGFSTAIGWIGTGFTTGTETGLTTGTG